MKKHYLPIATNIEEIKKTIEQELSKDALSKINQNLRENEHLNSQITDGVGAFSDSNSYDIHIIDDDDEDYPLFGIRSQINTKGFTGSHLTSELTINMDNCIRKTQTEKIKKVMHEIKEELEEGDGISWEINIKIREPDAMVYDGGCKIPLEERANPFELVGMFTENFNVKPPEEMEIPEGMTEDEEIEFSLQQIDKFNREGDNHVFHSDVAIKLKSDSWGDFKTIETQQWYHPYEDV